MADDEKIGKPWSDEELDAIVADYFAMLTSELSGQPYVKSHHSAALMAEIGRTHRSVEFKHQNISAVMEELGLPWIQGYKPKRNYQNAIFDAIDRFLTRTNWLVQPAVASNVTSAEAAKTNVDVFVSAPPIEVAVERPPRLERLVRKFDPVERDFRNRILGKAGEEFVVDVERNRLGRAMRQDLARSIRWISNEEGDGAGYDILSFEPDGRERLIEVKTTNGAAKTPFFLTRTEHEVSEQRADAWRLYRVHFFAQLPRIFTIDPPLAQAVHLRAEAWRASFT
jgi:hypothetical protein